MTQSILEPIHHLNGNGHVNGNGHTNGNGHVNGNGHANGNGVLTPRRRFATPDWLLMFSKFLRQGSTIASFVPSSRALSRAIVRGINFQTAECIVELGAGTGPITSELVRRANPKTRLIIIERDPDFCKRLREKFPHHDVVEGDAAELTTILSKFGVRSVDHVLSGLPMPSIPASVRERIMVASDKVLKPEGMFRQLTNMPWVYYRFYQNYFRHVRFTFVPMNLPPAGVYFCRGYKGPVHSVTP